MPTVHKQVTAPTRTELRKLVQQWLASAREQGFGYVEAGYKPANVRKTPDGYEIDVAVST